MSIKQKAFIRAFFQTLGALLVIPLFIGITKGIALILRNYAIQTYLVFVAIVTTSLLGYLFIDLYNMNIRQLRNEKE